MRTIELTYVGQHIHENPIANLTDQNEYAVEVASCQSR